MLTHFSLFTGIGGIDLAAEWAGFTTVGQCEFADYPTKVLEKHWPNVPRWRDVRDVTAQSVRDRGIGEITLLSGGFPCQPHSVAGKRKASLDERDLWGEFRRVISELRPKWVLGENVPGLLSSENGRFFGRVLNDLAALGSSVGGCVYGAADVGALHKRDRIGIVAYSNSYRQCGQAARESTPDKEWDNTACQSGREAELHETISGCEDVSNSNCIRCDMWGLEREGIQRENKACDEVNTSREYVSDTYSTGCQECNVTAESEGPGQYTRILAEGGDYWATEPNVGRVANGVPNRVDRLKCLGNAVVPQQFYVPLKAIAEIEKEG